MEPRPKKLMKTEAEAKDEAEIEPKQQLPDDIVLEIVARYRTIAGVIRFAAVSKPIRHGILHAPFLRRLRAFLLRNGGGEHGHGSPPIRNLLLGLYHESNDPRRPPAFVPASDDGADLLPPSVATLPPSCDVAAGDDDACEFGAYDPMASRRSLLVLQRRCRNRDRDHVAARHGTYAVELSVCNPATGERRVLPPQDVVDMSHVLLDADPTASSPSFRLLAVQLSIDDPSTLYAQVFSSESGEWGPRLICPITRRRGGGRKKKVSCEFACDASLTRPVVVGDTVHWLCTTEFGDRVLTWRWRGGGAEEEHEALVVKLPRGYQHFPEEEKKCLAVLPPAAGSAEALLGFIVLERGEIVVWAREKRGAGSAMKWKWKLWRRVQEASIPRPVNLWDGWMAGAELWWYCEGSGTLVMRAGDEAMSPLLLDLGNMEVSKVDARKWELNQDTEFCPYEVDLLSYMLLVMKRF